MNNLRTSLAPAPVLGRVLFTQWSSRLVVNGAVEAEELELTRFGGHLTVPDTEVFSEWIIEKTEPTAESASHIQ